jgi:hypothetical protein
MQCRKQIYPRKVEENEYLFNLRKKYSGTFFNQQFYYIEKQLRDCNDCERKKTWGSLFSSYVSAVIFITTIAFWPTATTSAGSRWPKHLNITIYQPVTDTPLLD